MSLEMLSTQVGDEFRTPAESPFVRAFDRLRDWVDERWRTGMEVGLGERVGVYTHYLTRVYRDEAEPKGVLLHVWLDQTVMPVAVDVPSLELALRTVVGAAIQLSPPESQILLWMTEEYEEIQVGVQVRLPGEIPTTILEVFDAVGPMDPFAPGRRSPHFSRLIGARWILERLGASVEVVAGGNTTREFRIGFRAA